MEAVANKQASDVVLLDMRSLSCFADYFVICTAESERQIIAIIDEVIGILEKEGVKPLHQEGTTDSGWALLDFGNVVIHIFSAFERKYYQLDELWSKAVPLVRIQ